MNVPWDAVCEIGSEPTFLDLVLQPLDFAREVVLLKICALHSFFSLAFMRFFTPGAFLPFSLNCSHGRFDTTVYPRASPYLVGLAGQCAEKNGGQRCPQRYSGAL